MEVGGWVVSRSAVQEAGARVVCRVESCGTSSRRGKEFEGSRLTSE